MLNKFISVYAIVSFLFISAYAQPYTLLAPPSVSEWQSQNSDVTEKYWRKAFEVFTRALIPPDFSAKDMCRDLLIWLDTLNQQDNTTEQLANTIYEFLETDSDEETFSEDKRACLAYHFSKFKQYEELNEKLYLCETIALQLNVATQRNKSIEDIKADLPNKIGQFLADIDFYETYESATSSLPDFERQQRSHHDEIVRVISRRISGEDIDLYTADLQKPVLIIPGLGLVIKMIYENISEVLDKEQDEMIRHFSIFMAQQYLNFRLGEFSSNLMTFSATLLAETMNNDQLKVDKVDTLVLILMQAYGFLFKEPLATINTDLKTLYRLSAEFLSHAGEETAEYLDNFSESLQPPKEIPRIFEYLYFQLGSIISTQATLDDFLQWVHLSRYNSRLTNDCYEIVYLLATPPFDEEPYSCHFFDLLKNNEHIHLLHDLVQEYRFSTDSSTAQPLPQPHKPHNTDL